MITMMYKVSINYYDFTFDNLADACTFSSLAKRTADKNVTVSIEFISILDLEENNNDDND